MNVDDYTIHAFVTRTGILHPTYESTKYNNLIMDTHEVLSKYH